MFAVLAGPPPIAVRRVGTVRRSHLSPTSMWSNVQMASVVTISASYGTRGGEIARQVADRLDLPFLDRAIPPSLAQEMAQSGEIEESLDEPAPSRWERIIMGFANATTPMGPNQLPTEVIETPDRFRKENEAKLRDVADTTGGVILGRAGMAVLGSRPDVLCARLDGPVEARIAQAMAQGLDEDSARKGQRAVDRAAMRTPGSSSTYGRMISGSTMSSSTAPPFRWMRASTSSSPAARDRFGLRF